MPPAEARLRAVADVNVLVSAARSPNGLCGRLVEAAIEGRWQPVVSMLLFEELEAVLARPAFRNVLGQEATDRFLAGLLAVVEWADDPPGSPAALARDPDDDARGVSVSVVSVDNRAMKRSALGPTVSLGSRDPLSLLPGVSEKLRHYVYALRDPLEDGRLFYVGKGVGDRVYAHARHAKRVDSSKTSAQLKLTRIREIHAAGLDVGVELIRHNLADEAEAFEVEAAVIDVLKIAGIELANVVAGHGTERGWRPLEEIMAEYAARPVEIRPDHRVLLIRLNRAQWVAPGDLYEKTRASWKVAPERHRPEWVFAVYGGIVRAVYRIESWERPPEEKRVGKGARRWDFNGVRDLAMEDIYLWTDVSGYLRRGAQNPITYVHC